MMVMSVTFALHFHGMKTSWERYMIVTCIFEPEYYKHNISYGLLFGR